MFTLILCVSPVVIYAYYWVSLVSVLVIVMVVVFILFKGSPPSSSSHYLLPATLDLYLILQHRHTFDHECVTL
jgi:hypothetical protein